MVPYTWKQTKCLRHEIILVYDEHNKSKINIYNVTILQGNISNLHKKRKINLDLMMVEDKSLLSKFVTQEALSVP